MMEAPLIRVAHEWLSIGPSQESRKNEIQSIPYSQYQIWRQIKGLLIYKAHDRHCSRIEVTNIKAKRGVTDMTNR